MSKDREGRVPSQRQLRVGEAIRQGLAEVLMRGEVHELADGLPPVTITEVRMTPDLKLATVYMTTLGGTDVEAAIKTLASAAAPLSKVMARRLTLKYMPRFRFLSDTSFDSAARIEGLLLEVSTDDEDQRES